MEGATRKVFQPNPGRLVGGNRNSSRTQTGSWILGGNSDRAHVTGPEQRNGPRANRFQRINGQMSLLLPTLVLIVFIALAERKSGDLELSFLSDQRLPSPSFCVKDFVSTFPVRKMAP